MIKRRIGIRSARKPHGIEPIELAGDTDQRQVTRA